MRRSIVAASAITLLVVPLASPGLAAPPQRGCPPPFMLLDFEGQVELAVELSGLPREDAIEQLVRPGIDQIDKNGDEKLCFAFQNKVKGLPNIIDNASNARKG